MGLETKDALRLRAYTLLVDEQINQAVTLLNERTGAYDLYEAPDRILEAIRLKERQLQNTGDNLEGAMKLVKDAKEATNMPHNYTSNL